MCIPVHTHTRPAHQVLMAIVTRPLEHCTAVLSILQLSSWPPLLAHLSHAKQKEVATKGS